MEVADPLCVNALTSPPHPSPAQPRLYVSPAYGPPPLRCPKHPSRVHWPLSSGLRGRQCSDRGRPDTGRAEAVQTAAGTLGSSLQSSVPAPPTPTPSRGTLPFDMPQGWGLKTKRKETLVAQVWSRGLCPPPRCGEPGPPATDGLQGSEGNPRGTGLCSDASDRARGDLPAPPALSEASEHEPPAPVSGHNLQRPEARLTQARRRCTRQRRPVGGCGQEQLTGTEVANANKTGVSPEGPQLPGEQPETLHAETGHGTPHPELRTGPWAQPSGTAPAHRGLSALQTARRCPHPVLSPGLLCLTSGSPTPPPRPSSFSAPCRPGHPGEFPALLTRSQPVPLVLLLTACPAPRSTGPFPTRHCSRLPAQGGGHARHMLRPPRTDGTPASHAPRSTVAAKDSAARATGSGRRPGGGARDARRPLSVSERRPARARRPAGRKNSACSPCRSPGRWTHSEDTKETPAPPPNQGRPPQRFIQGTGLRQLVPAPPPASPPACVPPHKGGERPGLNANCLLPTPSGHPDAAEAREAAHRVSQGSGPGPAPHGRSQACYF